MKSENKIGILTYLKVIPNKITNMLEYQQFGGGATPP